MKLEDKLHLWEQYFTEADKKKKKPYDSMKITTGDINYNIKQFNKHMGTDFNNPSTEEAKAQKAAETAAKNAGTFASQSPDGASSISTGEATGGEAGGCCEALNEEKIYISKLDKELELPDIVHIVDKEKIEAALEKLEPEEEFEVGYITPVYFYKELVDKFTLMKCTQLRGYTGVDYIEARANDDANKAQRIQISKDAIALGNANGIHLDRQPLANKVGDFSAQYASTNKTVLQDNGKTLLFYPLVGSRPKVLYFLDLYNGMGYMPVKREMLERTILNYVKQIESELVSGVKKDGTKRARKWGDFELAAKIQKQLETDARTIEAVPLDAEHNTETRSKISGQGYSNIAKPQVRALYTNQIFYLKTSYETLGSKLMEQLQEAKRYVRRYYIRPQDIFCSNKADILKALIDIGDQNCSVYTLNNLGDEKDVTKLTNKDIIYYYDDGILYDKNKVKVMDYDLYIKHEEKRDNINPDAVSDRKFNDVYDDRMTDQTITEQALTEYSTTIDQHTFDDGFYIECRWNKDNSYEVSSGYYNERTGMVHDNYHKFYATKEAALRAYNRLCDKHSAEAGLDETFEQDFDAYNAFGECLVEGKAKDGICCICGEPIEGYGNNAEPVEEGRCCDACNLHFVIPARLGQMTQERNA